MKGLPTALVAVVTIAGVVVLFGLDAPWWQVVCVNLLGIFGIAGTYSLEEEDSGEQD